MVMVVIGIELEITVVIVIETTIELMVEDMVVEEVVMVTGNKVLVFPSAFIYEVDKLDATLFT
jgi:hypothetical protein